MITEQFVEAVKEVIYRERLDCVCEVSTVWDEETRRNIPTNEVVVELIKRIEKLESIIYDK